MGEEPFRWLNVYRRYDLIGGALFKYPTYWGNDMCTGEKQVGIAAHTNYWDDSLVVQLVCEFLRPGIEHQPEHQVTTPTNIPDNSDWSAAEKGIALNRRLLANIGIWGGAAIAATIAIWTGIDATKAILSASNTVGGGEYRERLLRAGVSSNGWLYKAEPWETIRVSYGQGEYRQELVHLVQVEYLVCTFPLREGTWKVFDISSDQRWATSRSLTKDSWVRSGQPAEVKHDGWRSSATRWPIHVRHLPEDPSAFDIEELDILPQQKDPTWVRVLKGISARAAGFLCMVFMFGYSLYLLIDLVPLYGGSFPADAGEVV